MAEYSCTSEETAGGDDDFNSAKSSGRFSNRDDGADGGGMFDSPLMNNPKYNKMWEDNE